MLNLWLINIKFNLLENCCCIRGKHLGYVVSVKKKGPHYITLVIFLSLHILS